VQLGPIIALLLLPRDFVILAYQFAQFRATNYKYAKQFNIIDNIINQVTNKYLAKIAKTLSKGQHSQLASIELLTLTMPIYLNFLASWAIDKLALNAIIKKFVAYVNKHFPNIILEF